MDRPEGLCEVETPRCLRCGNEFYGRITALQGGVLVTCFNRRRLPDGTDKNCNAKLLMIPMGTTGLLHVTVLQRSEFEAIRSMDHTIPLRDRLAAVGIAHPRST